jgi:hypothetical protein
MKRYAVIVAALLGAVGPVLAFGVDPAANNLGSEHEKITRAGITTLEPGTMRQLAGAGEFPGAVGYPDDGDSGLSSIPQAHCLGGDHLESTAPARRQLAEQALAACRTFIRTNMDQAVELAGALAEAGAEDVALGCRFGDEQQSAKCKVLEHLGRALHAAQDFYANTNWVDRPADGPVSVDNPPGLGQSGPAAWLDLRRDEALPEGLVSACAPNRLVPGISFGCEDDVLAGVTDTGRISMGRLAKSTGPIGRGTGGKGTTPRGAINGNFARAVTAAVQDTSDKWAYFRERVLAVHGRDKGNRILCAMQRDSHDPKACDEEVRTAQACADREAGHGRTSSDDDPFDPGLMPSAQALADATNRLGTLRRFCRIEEADVTRAFANAGRTADEGRAAAETSAIRALAYWGTCRAELGRRLPAIDKGAREALASELAKEKPDAGREQSALLELFSSCVLDARLRDAVP